MSRTVDQGHVPNKKEKHTKMKERPKDFYGFSNHFTTSPERKIMNQSRLCKFIPVVVNTGPTELEGQEVSRI